MDDDVGLHQQAVGAQGHQVLSARSGADQGDMAFRRAAWRRAEVRPPRRAPRRRGRSPWRGPARRRRTRPRRRGGRLPFGSRRSTRPAQRRGELRERPERRRQHLVDAGADHLGEDRARAFGADGDATGARLTRAGVKKSQQSGRSTALTGMPIARASSAMRRSSAFVAGGGEHQRSALEMRRFVGVGISSRRRWRAPSRSAQVRRPLGDDAERRARLRHQPRLGQRLVAAADDDDKLPFHPHEDGEGVELGDRAMAGALPERAIVRGRSVETEGMASRRACGGWKSLFRQSGDGGKPFAARGSPERFQGNGRRATDVGNSGAVPAFRDNAMPGSGPRPAVGKNGETS